MTTAFLNALTQVIASESLYGAKHPVSQRAMDAAYERLVVLQREGVPRTITFLEGEVVADGGEAPGITYAEIDLARVAKVRGMIPSLTHDRDYKKP